mgnify:CR=1 FL=1
MVKTVLLTIYLWVRQLCHELSDALIIDVMVTKEFVHYLHSLIDEHIHFLSSDLYKQ